MNAILHARPVDMALPAAQCEPARIALLGTGTVGSALLARLAQWQGTDLAAELRLVHVANSRVATTDPAGVCPAEACGLLVERAAATAHCAVAPAGSAAAKGDQPDAPQAHSTLATPGRAVSAAHAEGRVSAGRVRDIELALMGEGMRIIIDATASEAIASQHAAWVAQGIHVVTACKLGQGGPLARWQAIQQARRIGGAHYGDSATVGAGLPLLRALRELQAGGDRIHAVAGVLSGSLAWLFSRFDGLRPFSGFVREARAAGYTEPDPRDDLSGEDVRRKMLILARSAGVALEVDDVQVESLVPASLARVSREDLDGALDTLDAPLRARFADAYRNAQKLRFIARLDATGTRPRATVGLESLPGDDPLAIGAGTDNRVAIWSDRYPEQPLVIQGPGAGAEVTAAALLDDALRIARRDASIF